MIIVKGKVNYQEVYVFYLLCSEAKDLCEYCTDYGINRDKIVHWKRQL